MWFTSLALSMTSRHAPLSSTHSMPCSARTRLKATLASTLIAPTRHGSRTFGPRWNSLKIQGAHAAFEGGSVNIGGADREKIVASLKDALGGAITIGAPADKTANPTSGAIRRQNSELARLKTGFGAEDVAAALNDARHQLPERRSEDSHFDRIFPRTGRSRPEAAPGWLGP